MGLHKPIDDILVALFFIPSMLIMLQLKSSHPNIVSSRFKKLKIRPRQPKYISHEKFHILKGGSQKNPSRFKETQS